MDQIIPVIFILVGLIFVIIGLITRGRINAATKWPSVQGAVLKSEVADRSTTIKTGEHRRTNVELYEPVVEYQYIVNGTTFTGKRLSFGSTRLHYEDAQAVAGRYPAGAQVPVYYNPKNPRDARLEVTSQGATAQLILGIIFGVVGIIWLVITLL